MIEREEMNIANKDKRIVEYARQIEAQVKQEKKEGKKK